MNADAQSSGGDVVRRFSGEHPATRDGGVVEIDFNLANSEGVNIYSRRDGGTNFRFLARATELAAPESDEGGPPCLDNHPMLVAGRPELREYKAVFVVADKEVSQFSDKITVNCAPLV